MLLFPSPRWAHAARWLLAATLCAPLAYGSIVERVVAVVGERPILLSELRLRAKPYEGRVGGTHSERAAQRSQLFTEMLDRMVDEELMRRAASRAKVSVTEAEVDAALDRIAAGNQVTTEELLLETERSGVNRAQYRREIKGQLLDAKVMNVRLQGRMLISEEDVQSEYQQLVVFERRQLPVRVALLRIEIPNKADPTEAARLGKIAEEASQKARAGADFDELRQRYSTHPSDPGDATPPLLTPAQMPAELARTVVNLDVGEVSSPVRSNTTLVVLKVLERAPSSLPAMDRVWEQLMHRVHTRKMEKMRRRWLDDMRRRTHVEIRL